MNLETPLGRNAAIPFSTRMEQQSRQFSESGMSSGISSNLAVKSEVAQAPAESFRTEVKNVNFMKRSDLLQRKAQGSSTGQTALLSLIPVLLMCGLWAWSANLSRSPDFIKSIFHLSNASLPQLPPAGLEVLDLRSQFVTLDDGQRVLEIRGNLLNATMKSFESIKLEAKLYNHDNKELQKIIVDSRTGLADARIEALSPQAISEMQHQAPVAAKLSPNDRLPIRIIFPQNSQGDLNSVQWFSTRVYSTQNISG